MTDTTEVESLNIDASVLMTALVRAMLDELKCQVLDDA